eukprot:CAMPEP_0171938560 /NCGR_PEP_ID=MMETSP0993-20121228/35586_1 /TAXON_ID=483369 /ORGANISM="non described non described, Strain CCMP2098" /LENGTH=178 /DNA_ID=CAMNT_0012580181 /DNA_START=134 /DNA_END=667 /DNA_ORIENTATION=+
MDKRIISVTAAAAALGIGYAIYASTKEALANGGIDLLWNAANQGDLKLRQLAEHKGHVDLVLQLLLKRGAAVRAAVNQARNDGFTPLCIAVQKGHLDVVQLLLDGGAAVNQASNDGSTLLLSAVHQGRLDVVQLLLKRGAAVNQASNDGFTPLYIAVLLGRLDLVQLLLDRGAAVNQA